MLDWIRRAWRTLAPLIVLISVVLLVWRFNHHIGTKLAATFLNAEGAVGLWTVDGLSLGKALLLGITCSTYDTFMWCWMFRGVYEWLVHAERALDKIRAGGMLRRRPVLKFFALWGLRGLFSFSLRPSACEKLKTKYDGVFYTTVLIVVTCMGFFPGCIWSAIFLIVAFKIDFWWAFPCLAAGNAMKIGVFGTMSAITSHIATNLPVSPLGTVGIAFVAIMVFQTVLKKTLGRNLR
jgi:hypothetical protein